MIKIVLLLCSAISIFLASLFITVDNSIFVEQSVPTTVMPGSEFTISLVIHKGKQTGFARLQHFLPKGFTAEPLETAKAQFINDEESAKFIWIALPAEEVFTVSYKVKVDSTLQGRQVINGLFYYIQDEKTQKLSLVPIEINIGEPIDADLNKPEVERKLISIDPNKGEFRVELKFHTKQEKTAAKFTDEIPNGFKAEAIENYGAAFSFHDQKAEFNWTTFPTEDTFTIAYRVYSTKESGTPKIDGMLVYGDNLNLTDDGLPKVKDDNSTPDSIMEELVKSENEERALTGTTKENLDNNSTVASESSTLSLSAPQIGIYYKVQICATRTSPSRESIFFEKKYKVTDKVQLTEHEGWKKYIIGNCSSIEQAKALKKLTRLKVGDAFVVAYNNGERVPVSSTLNTNKQNQ